MRKRRRRLRDLAARTYALEVHFSALTARVIELTDQLAGHGHEHEVVPGPTLADLQDLRAHSLRLANEVARLSIDLRTELAKAVDTVRIPAAAHSEEAGWPAPLAEVARSTEVEVAPPAEVGPSVEIAPSAEQEQAAHKNGDGLDDARDDGAVHDPGPAMIDLTDPSPVQASNGDGRLASAQPWAVNGA